VKHPIPPPKSAKILMHLPQIHRSEDKQENYNLHRSRDNNLGAFGKDSWQQEQQQGGNSAQENFPLSIYKIVDYGSGGQNYKRIPHYGFNPFRSPSRLSHV